MTDKLKGRALLEAWVAALRSGEYRQTTGAMHDTEEFGGGYCCLGVLHEISGGQWSKESQEWAQGDNRRRSFYALHPGDSDIRSYEILPSSPFDGLTTNGVILSSAGEQDLAALNDKGMSFSQIAELIEKSADSILGDAS